MLMSAPELHIPFHRLQIRTCSVTGTIPPRLLLAAINMSIVSISFIKLSLLKKQSFRLPKDMESMNPNLEEEKEYLEFELDCSYSGNTVLPEIPIHDIMGIVSYVDIENQFVCVKLPYADAGNLPPISDLNELQPLEMLLFNQTEQFFVQFPDLGIRLMKGNLQLPINILYAGDRCVAPYMMSECYGIGSGNVTTRSNLKRRSSKSKLDI